MVLLEQDRVLRREQLADVGGVIRVGASFSIRQRMSVLGSKLARQEKGEFVRDRMLTSDVPLGLFEGTKITVYSAKGRNARLHVRRECGQLRTSNVTTTEVPLNADAVERFCSGCADWGPSVRPTSGLGLFMNALGGTGLLHQLQAYAEPDEDVYWTQDEVRAAAELLRAERDVADEAEDEVEEDDLRREARGEAQELQERVLSRWRHAAQSLHRAQAIITHFPWLSDWAKPKVSAKASYLETLRAQAALFVEPSGLLVAAAAASLETPPLPSDDPGFAVLGNSSQISTALSSLWRRWQYSAERSWEGPESRAIIRYDLVHGIRSNKKGRAEAREGAARLIQSWEDEACAAVATTDSTPTVWVTARLPEGSEEPSPGGAPEVLEGLDRWTLGVVVTWTATADWGRRTLKLRVPPLVADRLLAPSSSLTCEPGGSEAVATEAGPQKQPDFVRPGVFDDAPIFDRQPVTPEHLRALRKFSYAAADQLYIVFSTSGGAEVLPLEAIETRLAQGWLGIIVASASDLPDSVITPWSKEAVPAPEAGDAPSSGPGHARQDGHFGADLGLAAGARDVVRRTYPGHDKEHNLRLLAMARGVSDLRTLDTGRSGMLPLAVWEGLLASSRLDLMPFRPPSDDRWRAGSSLPLGVLGQAQIYATNSDPKFEGRGHSPLCRHTRDRGLAASDDLLTVADLLARDDWDWCSKCGGYAVRRLTDTQLSYYRAAHRLHDIAEQLDDERTHRVPVDPDALIKQLEDLAGWEPGGHVDCGWDGSWRWHEVIRNLRRRAERKRGHTAS
ncbi:hypothetical protein ACGFYQ_08650 [Streptomyces sp. NPDC048258]|uniref:hypothetical protein n=1 Tax=Streptomyces sp. NPDC048258 TaxID=3365527 RepID=UPI003710A87C